jgi:hypothetical protein
VKLQKKTSKDISELKRKRKLYGSVQLNIIRVITSPYRRNPSSAHYTNDRLQYGFQRSKSGLPIDYRQWQRQEREKPAHNTKTKSAKLE